MAITAGNYGIGYKADGNPVGSGDTGYDMLNAAYTIAGGYTTISTALADIGKLTGDLYLFVFYGDALQGKTFAESLTWPNVDQSNLYRIYIIGQLGSVYDKTTQVCVDATGIAANTFNITTGTNAVNSGVVCHNLYFKPDTGTRCINKSTSSVYMLFSNCNMVGAGYASMIVYQSSGGMTLSNCIIINQYGYAAQCGALGNYKNCLILSSSYCVNGTIGDMDGCTLYGGTYGIHSGFVPNRCFSNNIVYGGTYAIDGAYTRYRVSELCRKNNLFYSAANPTNIASGATPATYFGFDYNYMQNTLLANPLFINAGGYTPADYALQSTSPALPANQTLQNNALYSGNKLDPITFGSWSNYVSPTYAAAANVLEGVDRGDGTLGIYHEATTAEVKDGTLFGPSSSYEGTYDPVTGNYTDPGVSNVINDTSYYFGGLQKTGTFASPPTTKVELGYGYGAGGTEYTGTYSPTLPTAPTLAVVNDADGTGATYTISSGESGATNNVYYFEDAETSTSVLGGARAGNGTGSISITTDGDYWFYCRTQTSGGYNLSNLVRVRITNDSNTSISEEEDYIYDEGQQITVETRSQEIGTRAERIDTWTTSDTIWGWKQPTSSALRTQYEERGILVTCKVFVAEDPVATEGDRLDIGGTKYLVRGVVDQSGTGTLWRIDCEEVK